jgi:hypothetical protein
MKPLQTRTLLAVKPHMYGTRHLTAGEEYEAPLRDAVAMVVSRKARFQTKKHSPAVEPPPAEPAMEPPENPPEKMQSNSIDALRLQATQLGIDVDGRWGVARLQYEISQRQR